MKKRTIALLMAVVMLFGVVGATVAYLTAESNKVQNTFTFGDITIDLNETDNEDADTSTKANAYDLIPGDTAVKDPKVKVDAGSEKCYVFVKVTEQYNTFGANNKKVIEYTVDSTNWIPAGEDIEDIYVYTAGTTAAAVVDAALADKVTASVLKDIDGVAGKQIKVNVDLTKTDITAMGENTPVLTFDAAAVQSENITFAEAKTIAIGLLNATPNP